MGQSRHTSLDPLRSPLQRTCFPVFLSSRSVHKNVYSDTHSTSTVTDTGSWLGDIGYRGDNKWKLYRENSVALGLSI
jgi:hypothetical protein